MDPKGRHDFQTTLVPGGKRPYDTWTFVVLPPRVVEALGRTGAVEVKGTLQGVPFRGTVSTGEGVRRMPVPRALLEQAGVSRGDRVRVELERDREPREIPVPEELQAVLDGDPRLDRLFHALPPSLRRAWASHVGEARRPETRARRAAKAPAAIRGRLFPGQ